MQLRTITDMCIVIDKQFIAKIKRAVEVENQKSAPRNELIESTIKLLTEGTQLIADIKQWEAERKQHNASAERYLTMQHSSTEEINHRTTLAAEKIRQLKVVNCQLKVAIDKLKKITNQLFDCWKQLLTTDEK